MKQLKQLAVEFMLSKCIESEKICSVIFKKNVMEVEVQLEEMPSKRVRLFALFVNENGRLFILTLKDAMALMRGFCARKGINLEKIGDIKENDIAMDVFDVLFKRFDPLFMQRLIPFNCLSEESKVEVAKRISCAILESKM